MATMKTFIKGGFRHFQCDDEESCLRLSFLIKDAGYGFKMSSNWVKKHTEFKIIAAEKDPMEDPKVIKGVKALRINIKDVQGKKASASEVLRNLESRIARLERQASSQGLNIIYEKIEDLSKNHLKRLGKKYPLDGGGFNRIVSETFPLDLSAMELKEVTKYFTENQKRNVVIIKDDKEINSIVEKYLDRNEYFKLANARSAGGSPFCVLKSTKRGFVLELQMSTIIKNQKKRGPSPLDLIDLGFN